MAVAAALSTRARNSRRRLNIAPVYEGWERNPDGSFEIDVRIHQSGLERVDDLPVGPDNTIDPGGPDRGQPTNFFPRRNRFVFRVRVPKDFGNKELVWTLTSKGRTEKAYGTLRPDYMRQRDSDGRQHRCRRPTGTVPDIVGNTAPS